MTTPPTLQQVAGRVIILLLQNNREQALEELHDGGALVIVSDGEPLLIDLNQSDPCQQCSPEQYFRCQEAEEGRKHSCPVFALAGEKRKLNSRTDLEGARDEAAARNLRNFGTHPSWFGR